MSEHVDWIVDLEVGIDGRLEQVKKVLDFLMAEKIVSASRRELGGGRRLIDPGPAAERWSIQVCREVSICGLEVLKKRTVFDAGENGLDGFRCPSCGAEHLSSDLPWSNAVGAWFKEEPDDGMLCPSCQDKPRIAHWTFLECDWALGNLGFGFHNWTIKHELASEIGQVLKHRFKLVHQHY